MYDLVNFSVSGFHGGTISDSANDVDSARILVSMVVNLMATLCIAVKVWYDGLEHLCYITFTSCRQFRGSLRLAFSKSATRKSLVNQVLTLLTEGGAIFCALQV